MDAARENSIHFPGFSFPKNLRTDSSFAALLSSDAVFLACATAGVLEFCRRIREATLGFSRLPPLITLCKGLVPESLQFPTVAIQSLLPQFEIGVLSGPTHAGDVALGKPTAAVIATAMDRERACRLQAWISSPSFRVYRTADVTGVELGGALKNPYAIGLGIAEKFAGSDNGWAALLTRMVAELARIGVSLGGQRETFYGLSGLGDLIATGNGRWSRNRTFGERIARGEKPEAILSDGKLTVEGYGATKGFHELCRRKKIPAPVLGGIYGILYEDRPPEDIRSALMGRSLREEMDGPSP
jgi:glycerol-3-phosphate dehydrogenase (NAD(P)+)